MEPHRFLVLTFLCLAHLSAMVALCGTFGWKQYLERHYFENNRKPEGEERFWLTYAALPVLIFSGCPYVASAFVLIQQTSEKELPVAIIIVFVTAITVAFPVLAWLEHSNHDKVRSARTYARFSIATTFVALAFLLMALMLR